jgi:Protein of unknown function (DUF2958)
MADRPDIQRYLDSLAPEQRAELEAFVDRFNQQVALKIEQLLHETQAPRSEEDLEMRARLLDGFVPLVSDDGALIFRQREELSIQDMQRFGAFMDFERERRQRETDITGERLYTDESGYTSQVLIPESARKAFFEQQQHPDYDQHDFGLTCYVKLFTPSGPFTLWVADFDGEDRLYGYVHNASAPELSEEGSFSLSELESLHRYARDLLATPVERDTTFKPTPLSEVRRLDAD